MAGVRTAWPFLTKSAQQHISCFEALVQLMHCAWQSRRSRHIQFVFTAEPLSHFIRLIVTFSHLHHITLQVSHLAGEKSTWADDLRRQCIARVANRQQDRVRITLPELASASFWIILHPQVAAWQVAISISCSKQLSRATQKIAPWPAWPASQTACEHSSGSKH